MLGGRYGEAPAAVAECSSDVTDEAEGVRGKLKPLMSPMLKPLPVIRGGIAAIVRGLMSLVIG